jgi:hypothetical protein
MPLLMLMPKRSPREKPGDDLKEEDGGWGPRLTFLCYQTVSDLLIHIHDAFEKRER